MRPPASTHHHGESHTEFCARCLAEVEAGAPRCPGCRTPLAGSGAFHVSLGTDADPVWTRLALRLPRPDGSG